MAGFTLDLLLITRQGCLINGFINYRWIEKCMSLSSQFKIYQDERLSLSLINKIFEFCCVIIYL